MHNYTYYVYYICTHVNDLAIDAIGGEAKLDDHLEVKLFAGDILTFWQDQSGNIGETGEQI